MQITALNLISGKHKKKLLGSLSLSEVGSRIEKIRCTAAVQCKREKTHVSWRRLVAHLRSWCPLKQANNGQQG